MKTMSKSKRTSGALAIGIAAAFVLLAAGTVGSQRDLEPAPRLTQGAGAQRRTRRSRRLGVPSRSFGVVHGPM